MESSQNAAGLVAVQPVSPIAPYVGGKRALAKQLVERISAHPHTLYAEPFVGMGGVFLRRNWRPRAEVINDISGDVVTLFRILQRHYQSFLDELKWRLASRAEFDRLMAVDPDTLTDLERAARFLYLQRQGFGGKVIGRTFGVDYQRGARFDLTKLVPMLEEVHDRLSGVIIERLTWQEFIAHYDRPGTLFYLDPPYFGTEHYYGHGVFSTADYEALRGALAASESSWIMSINDHPEIRRIFAGCEMQEVGLHYGVGGGATAARELIISGG